jgi:DNA-binding IclR family transcriptional regulator
MNTPVMRANAPESERDEANLLKAEIKSEYQQAKKMRTRGKSYLKAEFKRGKQNIPAPVMDRAEYRAHILSLSLFPNLFNKEMIHTNLGAS